MRAKDSAAVPLDGDVAAGNGSKLPAWFLGAVAAALALVAALTTGIVVEIVHLGANNGAGSATVTGNAWDLIGQRVDDPAVMAWLDTCPDLAPSDSGVRCAGGGFELVMTNNLVTSVVLYRAGTDDSPGYVRTLPAGLQWSDSCRKVVSQLGEPIAIGPSRPDGVPATFAQGSRRLTVLLDRWPVDDASYDSIHMRSITID
jgi:hypothetical protein